MTRGVSVLLSLPLASLVSSLGIMSCERERKYRKDKFPFLDCAMVTELICTALLFEFRSVSLCTRCFVVLQSSLATLSVTFSSYELSDKGNRKIPDRVSSRRVSSDIFRYLPVCAGIFRYLPVSSDVSHTLIKYRLVIWNLPKACGHRQAPMKPAGFPQSLA